jgi:hypothetical protein
MKELKTSSSNISKATLRNLRTLMICQPLHLYLKKRSINMRLKLRGSIKLKQNMINVKVVVRALETGSIGS